MTVLYKIPAVEQLLQTKRAASLISRFGRPLTVTSIRTVLQQVRADVSEHGETLLPEQDGLLDRVTETLVKWTTPTLLPVINASGVILHTNLGRAPLSTSAIAAMQTVSAGYSTLEFDLETGKRGSRILHAEALLKQLTGAEAALVVNNNAAAVLLILSTLASRKNVIIARSQLVEIGGGFRIPDVMKQSGAKLVEIGTTNKVRLTDYQDAITPSTALVMHAHRSNFKMIGFTEEPEWKQITQAAHQKGIDCLDDLGSGVLLDTAKYGLLHEPTVQESLSAGSDLVCFSGDKLLGGPQAGILLGRSDLLTKIKRHPLTRAVRADKLCLAALNATLLHYLRDEAQREIPVWQMIAAKPAELKKRVRNWVERIGAGEIIAAESTIGGGSLPGETLPGFVLALMVKNADRFTASLRQGVVPIIARVDNGRVLLDPRTVLPGQENDLMDNLMAALKRESTPTKAKRKNKGESL